MKKWTAFLGLLFLCWLIFGADGGAQDENAAEEAALETFVPSEELPADKAISFPADI